MEQVVPAEREHTQRPIRFVALLFVHRGAPKVIEEQILDGRVRSQVPIVLDRADIVENEATVHGVVVADNTSHHNHRSVPHRWRHFINYCKIITYFLFNLIFRFFMKSHFRHLTFICGIFKPTWVETCEKNRFINVCWKLKEKFEIFRANSLCFAALRVHWEWSVKQIHNLAD